MGSHQPPGKVSPTIKFARWSFLLCGFLYGSNRRAYLETLEKKVRILRHELWERRRKREKEITKKSYRELLIFLGKKFDMEFPPNWEPPN